MDTMLKVLNWVIANYGDPAMPNIGHVRRENGVPESSKAWFVEGRDEFRMIGLQSKESRTYEI